jgi:hypothetical protein
VGRAPRVLCWPSVTGRVVCMRDIFVSNEIWPQGKYISVGTWLD